MKNTITMPKPDSQPPVELLVCRPYLAEEVESGKLYTIIVGRDNTVLFFNPQDGTITHGTTDYLKAEHRIIRQYRQGEVLTYVQG